MITLKIQQQYRPLKSKIEYIFDCINDIYEFSQDIEIFYGHEIKNNCVQVIPGQGVLDFFASDDELPDNITSIDWKNRKLPILFANENTANIIEKNGKSLIFNYDLITCSFFFLSAWQEWHTQKSDKYGRFPAEEHFLYKENYIKIPVVNYYFDILVKNIEKHVGITAKLKSKNLKTIITHDIDQCTSGWKRNAYWHIRAGKIITGIKIILQKIFQHDIWFNFDEMMKVEEELGVKAVYLFIPTNEKSGNIENADYDFSSKKIKKVIEKLHETGHEIAFHGSFGTGFESKKLEEEVRCFKQKVSGVRFHYLGIQIPQTYDVLQKSGIGYDTSIGFSESVGFRVGYCYPFHPYNIQDDKPYEFLEFPLSAMDITMENKQYMNLTPGEALNSTQKIINEIKYFNGVFVLLWHNKFFTGFKSKWGKVFVNIIKSLKNLECTFILAKNYQNEKKEK